jgi:hypothetical protein
MEAPDCPVPCSAVDKKLEDMWTCIKTKVAMPLFTLLIFVLLVVLGGMSALQWSTNSTVVEIKTTLTQSIIHQNHLQDMQDDRIKELEDKIQ